MSGPVRRRLFLDQPDEEQRDHRADDRVDDRGDDAAADREPDQRQQPACDDCADEADNDVAHHPEAVAFDDLAPRPAGDRTDDQPDDDRLDHGYSRSLMLKPGGGPAAPASMHISGKQLSAEGWRAGWGIVAVRNVSPGMKIMRPDAGLRRGSADFTAGASSSPMVASRHDPFRSTRNSPSGFFR